MAEITAIQRIGPEHNGQPMTLEEFARSAGQPGYIYELEHGVIVVVDVPGVPHALVKQVIRNALVLYQTIHPHTIPLIAEGSDAAIRMPQMQSERHPDLALYLSTPPAADDQPWEYWIPDIVVEVVSRSSVDRDYQVKPNDYLRAGIKLYWLIDPRDRSATAFVRRGDEWREHKLTSNDTLRTHLLPGFELELSQLFRP